MELAESEANTISEITMNIEETERSIDLNECGLSIQESSSSSGLNNGIDLVQYPNRSTARRSSSDDRSSSKRQKKMSRLSTNESYRDCCGKSFDASHYSTQFRRKLADAGFHSCKDQRGTTVCIFCWLHFDQWNEQNDCPAYAHKCLSPKCPFVRTDLQTITVPSNDRRSIPVHCRFNEYSQRCQSFQGVHRGELWAQAGFFRHGSEATCFYCGISLSFQSSPENPLLQHLRSSYNCLFAQNQCGERISEEIKRVMQNQRWIDRLSQQRSSRLMNLDLESAYDLMMSREPHSLLRNFPKTIIMDCIRRQIELTDREITAKEVYLDVLIKEKLNQNHHPAFIPQEEMAKRDLKDRFPHYDFERRLASVGPVTSRNLNAIQNTFDAELQNYYREQKRLAAEHKEDASITIAREISTQYCTPHLPDPVALVNAGWMIDRKGESTKCPCCLIEYNQWKASDDPNLIHRLLSPYCLFIQSTNPLRQNEVQMKPFNGYYRNTGGATGGQQPYNGVAKLSSSRSRMVSTRLESFNHYPNGPLKNSHDLAINGFSYSSNTKMISCFSCCSLARATDDHFVPTWTHFINCSYDRQMKDERPHSTSSEIISELCGWCHENPKEYAALPCRDLAVCRSCAGIRRTCPICHAIVDNYSRAYK